MPTWMAFATTSTASPGARLSATSSTSAACGGDGIAKVLATVTATSSMTAAIAVVTDGAPVNDDCDGALMIGCGMTVNRCATPDEQDCILGLRT